MLEHGFRRLLPENEALVRLLAGIRPVAGVERLPLSEADGRVLAEAAEAARDVPHYDRSAMDGYAVRSPETAGASLSGPVVLEVGSAIAARSAVPVHTGSALPPGCDAVVPLEDAERDGGRVGVLRRVRAGENVGRRGEDVRAGDVVAPAGHVLRPQDLGLLRAVGLERVAVRRLPRVRVLVTGEELVAPGELPDPGRMVDANGVMLARCVARWGGEPEPRALYSDAPHLIAGEITAAAAACDLLVTSGGTSVGERDQVVEALAAAGEVWFHGVAIQPARPVAAGAVEGLPVLCLPGFPAAAFVAAFAFLRPALARLASRPPTAAAPLRGTLTRKIVSPVGLRSYTRVRVEDGRVEPLRTAGAGILSSLVRAQGFVVTPEASEGIPEGAEVDVVPFA
ncbi:MAG: gephyrin-like molybdotransferase Glp [Gemmatimonadota bacterium]